MEDKRMKVRTKKGWFGASQTGVMLGDKHFQIGHQYWTPVEWDDKEDPDFVKTNSLEFYDENTKSWNDFLYRKLI